MAAIDSVPSVTEAVCSVPDRPLLGDSRPSHLIRMSPKAPQIDEGLEWLLVNLDFKRPFKTVGRQAPYSKLLSG